jgi:hypothetical protein
MGSLVDQGLFLSEASPLQSVGTLWTAERRDLYLTTHNTHNRQTSMSPAGFEAAIPASERPQTARPGMGFFIIISYDVIYIQSVRARGIQKYMLMF